MACVFRLRVVAAIVTLGCYFGTGCSQANDGASNAPKSDVLHDTLLKLENEQRETERVKRDAASAADLLRQLLADLRKERSVLKEKRSRLDRKEKEYAGISERDQGLEGLRLQAEDLQLMAQESNLKLALSPIDQYSTAK